MSFFLKKNCTYYDEPTKKWKVNFLVGEIIFSRKEDKQYGFKASDLPKYCFFFNVFESWQLFWLFSFSVSPNLTMFRKWTVVSIAECWERKPPSGYRIMHYLNENRMVDFKVLIRKWQFNCNALRQVLSNRQEAKKRST